MKKLILLLAIIFSVQPVQAQLSNEAEISLITCGPKPGELYSAFGHTALRVKDLPNNIDLIFNYGIFDFDQPNFYLNFARGHLLYMLAVNRWSSFYLAYQLEGRSIREQVLNLDSVQKEAYWNFLVENSKPENRDYLYDYFYDNCATRVRDGLVSALPANDIVFKEKSFYQPPKSIRELCDVYLQYEPWGDFAIDFCLGLPMDREADAQIEMFLPDLLAEAFPEATINRNGEMISLVQEDRVLLPQKAQPDTGFSWGPSIIFALFLVLGVLATLFFYERPKALRWFDAFWSLLLALLGLFLLGLWLLTDHNAAAWNFNLLVFSPLYIAFFWASVKGRWSKWNLNLLRYTPYYLALLLAAWLWLPQQLNLSLLPLVALVMLRTWHLYYKRKLY